MRSIEDEKIVRFYKYRPDLGTNNRNLELITKSSAYFSHPSSFNDPFDCAPAPANSSDEQIRKVLKRLLDRDWLNTSDKEKIVDILNGDSTQRLEYIKNSTGTKAYVEQFMRNYIVFCLSKDPINRLLWSHYGAEHRGFVIEYDFTIYLDRDPATITDPNDLLFPMPVTYSNQRPSLSIGGDDRTASLYTKDNVWCYEEEHRIVLEGAPRLIEFQKCCISSIVLGARAPIELENALQRTIDKFNTDNETEVRVYRTELDDRSYMLTVPNHPIYHI